MASVPRALVPLFKLVQKHAASCPLPKDYLKNFPPHEGISELGYDLTGQCDNAASMFKFLAGGAQLGWRTGRLTGSEWPAIGDGSHYFVQHKSTKTIIDPTADQFPASMQPIPYDKAVWATSGGDRGRDPHGRRYPKAASRGWQKGKGWLKDAGIQGVLRSAKGKAAVAQAIAWSEKKSGKKFPTPDPSVIKLPKGDFPGFEESMGTRSTTGADEVFVRRAVGGSARDIVTITLTPLGREELEMKLGVLGRKRRNPALASEVMKAMKRGDTLKITREAAAFVKEELEHSLALLKDPSFSKDPSFAYQRKGIEHSLHNIDPVLGHVHGPASLLSGWLADARWQMKLGAVDLVEVHSLVDATRAVLRAKEGKCPPGGCVVKRDGKFRVISNKTGKLWPQTYETKKSATDAIAAYHFRKG